MKELYILKNVECNFNDNTKWTYSAEIILKVAKQLKDKQGHCESYNTSLHY